MAKLFSFYEETYEIKAQVGKNVYLLQELVARREKERSVPCERATEVSKR